MLIPNMDYYYEDDFFEDDENFPYFVEQQFELNNPTIMETFTCFYTTMSSFIHEILVALLIIHIGLKLSLKLIYKLNPNCHPFYYHLVIIFGGLSLLCYHFFNQLYFAFIVIFLTSFSLIFLLVTSSSSLIWLLSFTFITFNELIIYFLNSDFIKLRVFIMCLTMKLISLNVLIKYKLEGKEKSKDYTFIQLISYLLDPQAIPFCSYHSPNFHLGLSTLSSTPLILKSTLSLLRSLLYISASNCLLIYLKYYAQKSFTICISFFPINFCVLNVFLNTYLVALEFRTSHYFICSLIESVRQFWNQNVHVAKPSLIEFPRSLVDIVIAWDIPMHGWLKECVFLPSKKKHGSAVSIFITYAISSYVHGFRFEIWSVLFSLGFLTWVEFQLRSKLSNIYNACIGAKKCKYINTFDNTAVSTGFLSPLKAFIWPSSNILCTKGHAKTEFNSVLVILVNFLFSLLAIAHLAYLGSSFNLEEKLQTIESTFKAWSTLGFYSHIIGLMSLLFYYIL